MNDSVNSDVGSRVVARGDYSSKGRREREKRGRVVNREPASLRIFTIAGFTTTVSVPRTNERFALLKTL